jgi:hypothetical protein
VRPGSLRGRGGPRVHGKPDQYRGAPHPPRVHEFFHSLGGGRVADC